MEQEMNQEETVTLSKKTIRNVASALMDMSVMLMPVSGLSMMGLAIMAKKLGDEIGEKIEPSEEAYNGTINTITKIKGHAIRDLEKAQEEKEELEKKNRRLIQLRDWVWIKLKEGKPEEALKAIDDYTSNKDS